MNIVLETPHVVVGAAIAAKIGSPALSLPLALASHFILDKVPHWNPHLGTEINKFGKIKIKSTMFITLDALSALFLGSIISLKALPDTNRVFIIFLACFISVLPDVVEAPYYFLNIKGDTIERWVKIQKSIQVNASIVPGVLTQVVTVAAALWWIFS